VCKIGGSTGSGSISVGNIGTLVVDGSVTWQVASRVPFAVQAVPTEINGQPVPAGVYIDAAYVLNATIQNAQIADLAVDDNKIASLDVGKLTAGELNVGSFIQSTNYSPGAQGWKIHGNGFAEFGAATIRGQLTAAQIDSRGLSIKDLAGIIILASGTALDYTLVGGTKPPANADKTSLNTAAAITGQGAFATLNQITAANASTYIANLAVDTLQIAGRAVTVPAGASNPNTVQLFNGGVQTEIVSVSIPSDGSPIYIDFSVAFLGVVNGDVGGQPAQLILFNNGVSIPSFVSLASWPTGGGGYSSYSSGLSRGLYIENPGTGTRTFSLRMNAPQPATSPPGAIHQCSGVTIFVIGVKR
jgi:hypothetical protein